jgi:hypothetical protein
MEPASMNFSTAINLHAVQVSFGQQDVTPLRKFVPFHERAALQFGPPVSLSFVTILPYFLKEEDSVGGSGYQGPVQ